MSDFDLDRLGEMWRQQPDPAEMSRLQRTAIAVARRARLAAIVDVCTAIAVAAVVIILVITNPKLQTMVMGSAAILVLLGSNIRLRKLRRVELQGLTGTTEDMLDQSITRIETTLRHHKFTLWGTPLAVVGSWLGFTLAFGPRKSSMLGRFGEMAGFKPIMFGIAIAAVIALCVYVFVNIGRCRRELDRLLAMREAYRVERDSSGV